MLLLVLQSLPHIDRNAKTRFVRERAQGSKNSPRKILNNFAPYHLFDQSTPSMTYASDRQTDGITNICYFGGGGGFFLCKDPTAYAAENF